MSKRFEEQLSALGITLTVRQFEQFENYYKILTEWNEVMNLTAITERNEVNEKHFIDSLSLAKAVDISKVERIIDIGTGAGFPGIPLKIVYPHLELVLLDSLSKRVKFLDEVVDKLELDKVTTLHGRAEDYAKQDNYRGMFDLSVSRAVANLSTLSEYCLPYVKTGGFFVSYKSGEIDEEVKNSKTAVFLLGGTVDDVVKFELPGSDICRSFVKIKKEKATPKKYPRKAGLPAKEPL